MLPIAHAMKKRLHAREQAIIWLGARSWTVAILLRAMARHNGLPDARMGRERF
jgi:hypothetical protein